MEWGWSRKDCIQAIRDAGLPLPGQVFLLLLPQHEAVGNSDIVPPLPGFAAAGFGD